MDESSVFALIVQAVADVLPDMPSRQLRAEDSLESLGANSMDRAEIVMLVLDRMDLNIPLVETFGPKNLAELARLLAGRAR